MYIFVQSYILFLNYQIKIVKICIDNTEKSVLSVQIPTNTRLKTMSPMCHNDTWDSFVLLIMVWGLCRDKPYILILSTFFRNYLR